MLTFVVSETAKVAKKNDTGGIGHPEGNTGVALNCCWFPGAAAVWLAVASKGKRLSAVMLQSWVEAPQPAAAKHRSRVTNRIAVVGFMIRESIVLWQGRGKLQ